jgi:hypothetical protein
MNAVVKLGVDGRVFGVADEPDDQCCPPALCQITECDMACSFINLLPSGPLWDKPKAEALAYYQQGGTCDLSLVPPASSCQSLVAYAVYMGRSLVSLLEGALAPALRESSPHTAVTTLDDWLDRLGWQDCYASQCREVLLGDLTPYEVMGECGPIFCPPPTPDELVCAVKRGIVIALTRTNMGVIKNLDGLNWIIEPLGAVLTPLNVAECANQPAGPCDTCERTFTLCNVGDTLPACNITETCHPVTVPPVQAYIDTNPCTSAAGLPSRIWPGVIAAECIVRSLLPKNCPNPIVRCC